MAHSPSGESLIERVVRILESFDAHSPVLTISEIARRADLPVTTAHRLVTDLLDIRLLERTGDRGIHVGVRLWELSARASGVIRLRDVALPFMEDLHAVVRQHTQLGVLDGDEVLSIERLSTPGSIINATHVAGRLPAHACSAGLVLLAYSAEERREELLAQPLERYTARTIVDPTKLRAVFADIRARPLRRRSDDDSGRHRRRGTGLRCQRSDRRGADHRAAVRRRAGGRARAGVDDRRPRDLPQSRWQRLADGFRAAGKRSPFLCRSTE